MADIKSLKIKEFFPMLGNRRARFMQGCPRQAIRPASSQRRCTPNASI